MKQHKIIYITGLNDDHPRFQMLAIRFWKVFGVSPVFFHTRWSNDESFSDKVHRLLQAIDGHIEKGHTVSLFSVSAGASMAIAAYVQRSQEINGVACICGKLQRPEAVGEKYYQQSPAFRETMERLDANVAKLNKAEKSRIISITPLFDEVVTVSDAKLRGVKNVTLPTLFHVFTIGLAISVFSYVPIFFLKYRKGVE